MGVFLIILLVIFVASYLLFNPNFDKIELYCGEKWVIIWYNSYYIYNGKIKCKRNWKPLFSIKR